MSDGQTELTWTIVTGDGLVLYEDIPDAAAATLADKMHGYAVDAVSGRELMDKWREIGDRYKALADQERREFTRAYVERLDGLHQDGAPVGLSVVTDEEGNERIGLGL